MTEPITIYPARTVITGATPQRAEAVAVRDGRILAVGSMEDCRAYGPHVVDERCAGSVIVPGFVEAHSHAGEGATGIKVPFVGWYERPLPDGTRSPAIRSYEQLVARLGELADGLDRAGAGPDVPLIATGFDPIYFQGERRLDRHHLDAVATARPIYVQHASGHLATVSTRGLEFWSITADLTVDGIGRDEHGQPNGELREGAQSLARGVAANPIAAGSDPESIRWWAEAARRAGITTCTDLGSVVHADPAIFDRWHQITGAEGFPIRAVSYLLAQFSNRSGALLAEQFAELRSQITHDRWHLGGMKIVLDGSIQGWTAALSWPGYHTGEGHPMFLLPIERMRELLVEAHRAGINVHVHCNGDLAAEAVLEATEAALGERAWLDHRHTITHAQTMTAAQLRWAGAMGMGINFFANHLWFWGDQHHDLTLGPRRAARLDPCCDAARLGVPFALHSDAPVTPLGQLHTMWCAVNRRTPSGRVLGSDQCISATQALRAVTIDAAWMLGLDHEIGSIEVGKRADFTVLDGDPLTVEPDAIRDLAVVGTIVDGVATSEW